MNDQISNMINEIVKFYPVSPAVKNAEEAIEQYRHQLQALQDPKVSDQAKIRLATRIKPVHKSMQRLKDMMPEDKFAMFYRNVIEGQSMQSLGLLYGCAPKTIRRVKRKAYKDLALMLYPDHRLTELIIVGW